MEDCGSKGWTRRDRTGRHPIRGNSWGDKALYRSRRTVPPLWRFNHCGTPPDEWWRACYTPDVGRTGCRRREVGIHIGLCRRGPNGLSYVLQLLDAHGVEIDEYAVSPQLLERVNQSALTRTDLLSFERMPPIRPSRWYDYIFDRHENWHNEGRLWQNFPHAIPFSIIDPRIVDLALSFWKAPDERLLTAYRRLEDLIRKRTGLTEHGSKLFSQAFLPQDPKLHWPGRTSSEQTARGNLFVGAFGAFRNPRTHRELQEDTDDQLAEFLLVNQLYRLEREAEPKPS